MNLLEANTSSAVLNDKKSTKSTKKDEEVDTDKEVKIVSDNALSPVTNPLGVSDGETGEEASFDQISVYVVRKGDTINAVADMFGVTVNTIKWANDLKSNKLTVGDTLIILPVSGLKYKVEKGDTLKSIAKDFKVEVADITDYNDLASNAKLVIGQELIIPGAEVEVKAEPVKTTKNKIKSGGSIPANFNSSSNTNNASGYYIKPIPCRLTQGRHDKYAVDMSCGKVGTPILAAASGKVIFAKYGWNGAFGNLVIISHPNGTQTFYAHQSEIAVSVGDQVSQGQTIGYVGNTGRSTGPHLHFEVRGAKNPGFDNSWKE